jgi:circadian clock protein KaiB
VLCLYIAGATPLSQQAVTQLKEILERHLAGRYVLRIVDLYQQPGLAKDMNVIAAPTLVKERPFPIRRLVGSMASADRVLHGLDVS